MCELQPAFLAGMGSVHVHRPWPPRSEVGSPHHHGPVAPTPPDSTAWPVLWARCWTRIRTWRRAPAVVLSRLVRRGPRRGGGDGLRCGARFRPAPPRPARRLPLQPGGRGRLDPSPPGVSLRPPHPARRGDPRPPRPGTTRTRCRHTRTPGGRPGQPGRAGPRPDPPALLGRPPRGRSGPGMGGQPPGRQQA